VVAVDRFRQRLERELKRPHRLDQLAIDGSDLIAAGWSEGPGLGKALDHLLSCVIGDPALNTREWLLAEAERLRT
jgi:tRNA nucleotidyltransferase (CCA-adding enzyme)